MARVLAGDVNPSGRLPVTFYRDMAQLPPFEDYGMDGRTYRFLAEDPLYPFGYGLSYTRFTYGAVALSAASIQAGETLTARASVTNAGDRPGREIVQCYLQDREASTRVPRWSLAGFAAVELAPGETREVTFTLTPRQMAVVDESGRCFVEPGRFTVHIGGHQPDGYSCALSGTPTRAADFIVTGTVDVEP